MIPDDGLLNDLHHLFRREYYQSKRRGERNDTMLAFMGVTLVAMGSMMILRSRRGRER
jgi:hypothetical protein